MVEETAPPHVERAQVEAFLKSCIDSMRSAETREMLKDPSSGRPGPRIAELQKDVWSRLGVPTAAGRLAVSRIEQNFSEDAAALVELRGEFGRAVDAAYLQCLEDRRPSAPKKKGKMPRTAVLEFFDACSLMMDTPDVQARLRAYVSETGTMPESVVDDVHCEVMELLGFERGHGQSCFEEFGQQRALAQDREVAIGCARWRGKTSDVCLRLLAEHKRAGGELKVDEGTRQKLLELQAKEELAAMSPQERSALLERNAKKVNVFRALPPEGRERYLERLADQDKVELAMADMLMAALAQRREQEWAWE